MAERPDFNLPFGDPDLAARLETMSPGALDALPFGVVLLDQRDRILLCNSVERSRTGMSADQVGQDVKRLAETYRPFEIYVRSARERPPTLEAPTGSLDLDALLGIMTGVRVRVDSATGGGVWIVIDGRRGVSAEADAPPHPASSPAAAQTTG